MRGGIHDTSRVGKTGQTGSVRSRANATTGEGVAWTNHDSDQTRAGRLTAGHQMDVHHTVVADSDGASPSEGEGMRSWEQHGRDQHERNSRVGC